MGRRVYNQIEAPVYFGGKSGNFPFIDDQYDCERGDLDEKVMDALIATGIGENLCPTAGEWVYFCFANAIVTAVTGDTLIAVPKRVSLRNIEEWSWEELWHLYDTGQLQMSFNKDFADSLLRIFVIRQHTIVGPDGPYNQSDFVRRWSFSFNVFPDTLSEKICNVRLRHLQRGRQVFNTFGKDTKKNIELISDFIPLILKEINIAIEQ